jgi:maltoporin
VNNTTVAQTVQPRALTLMVTAGQWQAVKDILSRPNGRILTTSDTFGNSTTNTPTTNSY